MVPLVFAEVIAVGPDRQPFFAGADLKAEPSEPLIAQDNV